MKFLLTLCALMLVGGCNKFVQSVPGSGVIQQETRQVGDFTKVSFAGAADIKIVAGAEQAHCAIQCDDNLLQYVSTEVVDDELQIRLTGPSMLAPTQGLQMEISVPALSAVELAGGTTTAVTGVNSKSFDVSLAGSHQLSCEGQADNVHVKAAGACKVMASTLETLSTKVELAGSGSAEVQASDTLSVNIAGSGRVRYVGQPVITQSIAGSGKIEKLE